MNVLVAGVGNVLRGDDGFGVVAAQRLLEEAVPEGVRVVELGIGGIHLVQDLMATRVDALIVLDAVDLGRQPGTVLVVQPEVVDVQRMPLQERHRHLADMHYATPERAFMLARGLDVLPERLWVVGCQPLDARTPRIGLSGAVARGVDTAIDEVRRLLAFLEAVRD